MDEASGSTIMYRSMVSNYYNYSGTNALLGMYEAMKDSTGSTVLTRSTLCKYDYNGNKLAEEVSYNMPAGTQTETFSLFTYNDTTTTFSSRIDRTENTYDGFNRLVKTDSIKDGNRIISEYGYDGDDQRVSKVTKRSQDSYVPVETNYLYDGQNVILETNEAGAMKARYIRGVNYIARVDAAASLSYFLFNGHGDVVQTATAAGVVQNQYDYDIFGSPALTVESYECSIRYSGYFYDAETGLYYLNARYYDSRVGRFLTEDSYKGSYEDPLSLNLYTYCCNNPIMYTDPTGHESFAETEIRLAAQYQAGANTTNDSSRTLTCEGIVITVSASEAISYYNSGWVNYDGQAYADNMWIAPGAEVISVSTGDYSNGTIRNDGSIGTVYTGEGSYNYISNYGSIETINTGAKSTNLITNYSSIDSVNTGEDNRTLIYDDGHIGGMGGNGEIYYYKVLKDNGPKFESMPGATISSGAIDPITQAGIAYAHALMNDIMADYNRYAWPSGYSIEDYSWAIEYENRYDDLYASEIGKQADLLVLDIIYNIRMSVYTGGTWYEGALNSLLGTDPGIKDIDLTNYKELAIAQEKMDFINDSSYRYLIKPSFLRNPREAFIKKLETQVKIQQDRDVIEYNTAEEKEVYKQAIIDELKAKIKMNKNYNQSLENMNFFLGEIENKYE